MLVPVISKLITTKLLHRSIVAAEADSAPGPTSKLSTVFLSPNPNSDPPFVFPNSDAECGQNVEYPQGFDKRAAANRRLSTLLAIPDPYVQMNSHLIHNEKHPRRASMKCLRCQSLFISLQSVKYKHDSGSGTGTYSYCVCYSITVPYNTACVPVQTLTMTVTGCFCFIVVDLCDYLTKVLKTSTDLSVISALAVLQVPHPKKRTLLKRKCPPGRNDRAAAMLALSHQTAFSDLWVQFKVRNSKLRENSNFPSPSHFGFSGAKHGTSTRGETSAGRNIRGAKLHWSIKSISSTISPISWTTYSSLFVYNKILFVLHTINKRQIFYSTV